MLECYFDDSGTHASSKIAVWGGLVGSAEQFDKLSLEWAKVLADPLDGRKPSLRKMQLSSLRSHQGEFREYNQGETDLLRKRFRDIIAASGVECVAYIVNCDDWLKASTPLDRQYLGDARNFAFQGIMEFVAAVAKLDDSGVSCHFDQGARDFAAHVIESAWKITRPEEYKKAHFTYSSVEAVLPLQAADMIAHEAYHYGLHLIEPKKHPENPHFADLKQRANILFQSLHEPEMREYLQRWRAVMIDTFKVMGDQPD